jgi:hypothetical protein
LCNQGDQIGRIFAQRAIGYYGQFFSENYRSGPHFLSTFSKSNDYVLILTKMGWATFWAIFSQTHLVTLVVLLKWYLQLNLGLIVW